MQSLAVPGWAPLLAILGCVVHCNPWQRALWLQFPASPGGNVAACGGGRSLAFTGKRPLWVVFPVSPYCGQLVAVVGGRLAPCPSA